MKIIQFLFSEDAVSEVLDFVTILGILVLSIGLIGLAGYPILKKVQESNYIENTKQSFIVLAANINKVVLGQAPSQSVELKMYGGTLSVNMSSEINITAINSTNQPVILIDQPMGSIESMVGNTVIAYEGTGAWAKYPDGNTLPVSSPLITYQSNVLVIPVVSIWGTSSVGGSGMDWVSVCDQGCAPPSVSIFKNVSNINVTINSTYSGGWNNYLTHMSLSCSLSGSGSSVTCTAPFANVDVYILNVPLNAEVV